MTDSDPRFGLGANNPPLPEQISAAEDLPGQVTAYLSEHHAGIVKQVDELLDQARLLPKEIVDDEQMGAAAKLIKDLRDLSKRTESTHGAEKAPYLRSGQAADGFFFPLLDKIVRRAKANKPGAADILQTRVDDYLQRKLAREREQRRLEEERARRLAEEARRSEAEAARKADEDRLAAERARKPETIASKGAAADISDVNAAEAAAVATVAVAKAQEAHVQTLSKAADIVRTRVDGAPVVTMKTESYATVVDYDLLDIDALRPFIKREALDQALTAWAKVNNYNAAMAGAEIGRRERSVVR